MSPQAKAFETEMDEWARHLSSRIVGMDNPLAYKEASLKDRVMVRDWRGVRHYRLYGDAGGLYVRTGKRGQSKKYLGGCKIIYFDGNPCAFEFRLKD